MASQAADILYEYAKQLMTLREEAETTISEFKGDMRGSVVIGGSTIPGIFILPELLAAFRQRYANARIVLEVDGTDRIIQKLIDGSVELAIVGAKTVIKKISQRRFISDELALVIPAEHRWAKRESISFETLKKEPFIKRESGSGTWQTFAEGLKQAGFDIAELNIVSQIKHTQGVISGIKHRLGISILSPISIEGELKQKRLKTLKIKSVHLKRNFYLSWNSQRSFSPIGKQLKLFLEEQIRG